MLLYIVLHCPTITPTVGVMQHDDLSPISPMAIIWVKLYYNTREWLRIEIFAILDDKKAQAALHFV